jgi:hypothetical protein
MEIFIASGASPDEADHVPVDRFGYLFVDVTKSINMQHVGAWGRVSVPYIADQQIPSVGLLVGG